MKIVEQSVTVLDYTSNAVERLEAAARTCYKSEEKITRESAEKLIRKIIKRGHESVLEHAYMSCRIVTDRGISHEIVRHRIGCSYSQESTRYCSYGGDLVFIEPPNLDRDAKVAVSAVLEEIEDCYKWMIQNDHPPQIARSVLPNCLKTEIVMTANFRAWRHFITLRASAAAHPQIQWIANRIKQWFEDTYPVIVEDL